MTAIDRTPHCRNSRDTRPAATSGRGMVLPSTSADVSDKPRHIRKTAPARVANLRPAAALRGGHDGRPRRPAHPPSAARQRPSRPDAPRPHLGQRRHDGRSPPDREGAPVRDAGPALRALACAPRRPTTDRRRTGLQRRPGPDLLRARWLHDARRGRGRTFLRCCSMARSAFRATSCTRKTSTARARSASERAADPPGTG